jgi:hypothetical protein
MLMATTVTELFDDAQQQHGGNGGPISASRSYLVRDVDSEGVACEKALDEARSNPPSDEWIPTGAEIEERLDDKSWRVRVSFEPDSVSDAIDADEDPNNYTFDTGNGTMHRDVAIEHIATYPDDAPSFNGAIGVDGEGNVLGCDVVMPQPGFTETVKLSKNQFNTNYKKKLIYLTGKINDAAFRGFEKGEVLFAGASATRNGDDWVVTYRFSVSENKADYTIGGDGSEDNPGIHIVEKLGWDYIWFRYAETDAKDANGSVIGVVRTPVSAHVERVYEFADFNDLKTEED